MEDRIKIKDVITTFIVLLILFGCIYAIYDRENARYECEDLNGNLFIGKYAQSKGSGMSALKEDGTEIMIQSYKKVEK